MMNNESLMPLGRIVRKEEVPRWYDARAARNDLESARHALEASRTQVFAAAHDEGYASGLEAGKRDAALMVIKTTLQLKRRAEEIELQLPMLVLDIVENLLGQFDVGELLGASIQRAMKDLYTKTEISIQVSPTDFERVGQSIVELSMATGIPPIQLRSDDEMKSGDCRLTGDFGSLDLSLETQLNLLKNGIHESGMLAGNA
jgi:type III secretion protein L